MLDELAKDIVDTVRESVTAAIEKANRRIDVRLAEIEKRIAEIEGAEKPDIESLKAEIKAVSEAVSAIEIPEYKEITEDQIKEIAQSVIPEPVDIDVTEMVKSEVEKAVSAIEIPARKDGKDAEVDYDRVKSIVDETLKEVVASIDIPLPKNGEDGKDALEIEILPEIEEEKSYARGTYATHKGGLWRAYERTKGMRGWECITNGIAAVDVDYDGMRKAVISVETSDGEKVEKELKIPAVLHKGVWREGRYEKGDNVQLSGSSWICVNDTEERPTDGSADWVLSAKRGGTGDSAYHTARKNGFQGNVIEWLDSLGKKPKVEV